MSSLEEIGRGVRKLVECIDETSDDVVKEILRHALRETCKHFARGDDLAAGGARCEHCGRFSTVDVGEKLSDCLRRFRDARGLAVDCQAGTITTAQGAHLMAEVLLGQSEPT